MSVRSAQDFRCWQLADALRTDVLAICARKQIAHDVRFCVGFRDAAGSVCRNIAEGFARYESAEIVQFFRYALASLAEVKDYLKECEERGVVDRTELDRLADRCEHTKATATNFMKPHINKVKPRRMTRRP